MIETQLKEALVGLQDAIGKADAPAIRDRMAFIDGTLQSHRKELDAQLKHYLKNRSYMKALAYLNSESEIPKGRCGGRTDFS